MTELEFKIKAVNSRKDTETIGCLLWSEYRIFKHKKRRIPTQEDYEEYFIYCHINNLDAECLTHIKKREMQD